MAGANLNLPALQALIDLGGYGGRGNNNPSSAVLGLSAALFLSDLSIWQGAGDTLTDAEIDDIEELIAQLENDLMVTDDMYPQDRVKVTHDTNWNLNSATVMNLPFNTDEYDPQDMHDPASNNERLLCVREGLHIVNLNVRVFTFAAGTFFLTLDKYDLDSDTIITIREQTDYRLTGPNIIFLEISDQIELLPGDYIRAQVGQDTGMFCIMVSASTAPWFSMVRL